MMDERLQKAILCYPEFPWNNPEMLKRMMNPDEKYKNVSLYKNTERITGKKERSKSFPISGKCTA